MHDATTLLFMATTSANSLSPRAGFRPRFSFCPFFEVVPMKLYTCLEAAALLGVNDTRVRVLCRSGRLGRKHGRAWLITDQDLKRYWDAGPMKPGKKV